jgi:F0F1-type ATP synthase membrane subunit c/vacuolar-type H+-ATPase subunit K
MNNRKPIKVQYQTLVVIWFALLMSQVLFFLFIWFSKPELISARYLSASSIREVLGTQPLIIIVFAGSALIFFLLSQVIARQHMRRAVRDRDATCIQTGLVIGCALSEISSILGVILALLFNYPYFYLWIALGTLGILMNFPRRSNLDAATLEPGQFL